MFADKPHKLDPVAIRQADIDKGHAGPEGGQMPLCRIYTIRSAHPRAAGRSHHANNLAGETAILDKHNRCNQKQAFTLTESYRSVRC